MAKEGRMSDIDKRESGVSFASAGTTKNQLAPCFLTGDGLQLQELYPANGKTAGLSLGKARLGLG